MEWEDGEAATVIRPGVVLVWTRAVMRVWTTKVSHLSAGRSRENEDWAHRRANAGLQLQKCRKGLDVPFPRRSHPCMHRFEWCTTWDIEGVRGRESKSESRVDRRRRRDRRCDLLLQPQREQCWQNGIGDDFLSCVSAVVGRKRWGKLTLSVTEPEMPASPHSSPSLIRSSHCRC